MKRKALTSRLWRRRKNKFDQSCNGILKKPGYMPGFFVSEICLLEVMFSGTKQVGCYKRRGAKDAEKNTKKFAFSASLRLASLRPLR